MPGRRLLALGPRGGADERDRDRQRVVLRDRRGPGLVGWPVVRACHQVDLCGAGTGTRPGRPGSPGAYRRRVASMVDRTRWLVRHPPRRDHLSTIGVAGSVGRWECRPGASRSMHRASASWPVADSVGRWDVPAPGASRVDASGERQRATRVGCPAPESRELTVSGATRRAAVDIGAIQRGIRRG